MSDPILVVDDLSKTYASGETALSKVSLTIERGEILALLGPNGAGKTTLISIVCGLVTPSGGRVTVDGYDIGAEYRAARRLIGLVPQELSLEPFEKVWDAVRFARGLYGLPADNAYLESLLRKLSLWDKKRSAIRELSGGMKRRVLIAKALAHQPRLLFLDEPTAGVDVELRKDMWDVVRTLHAEGVTTVLTTHYIEEAEAIADRVGIISKGSLLLVEDKDALMQRMGRRQVLIHLDTPVNEVPAVVADHHVTLEDGALCYTADGEDAPSVGVVITALVEAGHRITDVETYQRSLEEIFVAMVRDGGAA